jgi:hypothetical protein
MISNQQSAFSNQQNRNQRVANQEAAAMGVRGDVLSG